LNPFYSPLPVRFLATFEPSNLAILPHMQIKKSTSDKPSGTIAYLADAKSKLNAAGFSKEELAYITSQNQKLEKKFVTINQLKRDVFILFADEKRSGYQKREADRRAGHDLCMALNDKKQDSVTIINISGDKNAAMDVAEGVALANYQFLKYKPKDTKEKFTLKNISVVDDAVNSRDIDELRTIIEANYLTRDLVNEPTSFLTATELANQIKDAGKNAGFKVEVLNKTRIQALKMGGLLAVNKGSVEPPTFTIMEYKPAKAKNKKPYVLVGKGVVYDTGGLSLKPTPNSMDLMKCDMAGAGAVTGALYAIAKAKLPVHVIALVPATDNRPGGDAYTPGDVITLHNGKTVEVLNTDAEGRLILGDALSYAQKYKPELVIDLATLTGAAVAAIGPYGTVAMGTDSAEMMERLKRSGDNVYERLAEMPFWEEYGDLIKSDVAEIKNVGGPYGGSITAGKFLHHFTDYPWIHLDIAGPAFLTAKDNYRGKGGTAVGVRLLFDFFKQLSSN
jgi:leucyl aminopeptidase